jgi:2',3'-cyclic-nucleotide 2'-phosphodiesterase/3'-nucleotidase
VLNSFHAIVNWRKCPSVSDVFRDLGPLSPTLPSLVHLRVLATTDLHASLMPFDYFTDRPDDRIGLVRVGGLVEALREGIPNCLLFDNGDTFQGSAGRACRAGHERFRHPHPMIVAMNALGYDAATLGNHDFDYGIGMLDRILSEAAFPVVLANAQHPGNGEPFRPRHVILDREVEDLDGGRHIHSDRRDRNHATAGRPMERGVLDGGLVFEDAVEATAREAGNSRPPAPISSWRSRIRGLVTARNGARRAMAGPSGNGMENVARAIAALQDVDAVVAGHTHEVFPTECDCDIFPPECPDRAAGLLGVAPGMHRFRPEQAARWHGAVLVDPQGPCRGAAAGRPGSRGGSGRPAPRPAKKPGPLAEDRSAGCTVSARSESRLRIGESVVALQTYFSTVAPCRATQLASDAQKAAAQGDRHRGRTGRSAGPLGHLSHAQHAARPVTDIPAGPILLRHVSDLYCYPNSLAVLRVRGRDLSDWLERAASIYHRIDPDDPSQQPLIDHASPDTISTGSTGCSTTSTSAVPARTDARGERIFDTPGRIRNLRHADGRPVDPEEETLVVTNSYRAAGGGRLSPPAPAAKRSFDDTVLVRDHIVDFIRAHCGPIRPEPSASFSSAGSAGAARRRNRRRGHAIMPISCPASDWFPSDPAQDFRPAYDRPALRTSHRDGESVFPPDFLAFCTIFGQIGHRQTAPRRVWH